MKTIFTLALLLGMLIVLPATNGEDWTRFRGPNGTGISASTSAPISWDATKNIGWQVDLPGPGSSCPIVHDGRVYVTCYTGYGVNAENPGSAKDLKRHLLCFDKKDGTEIWRSTVDSAHDEDPFTGFITDHGYASSTPVTDGKHLFVHFGKTGVFAFDMNGKQVWHQHVGTKSDPAKWGNGASCVLYQDLVILNAGNTDHSIIAFKKSDGSEAWRVRDEKFTNSWSTPIIVNIDGQDEMIINMPGKILAYDPSNGNSLWSADSPIERTVCGSVVYDQGIVYAMGGRSGRAIAVRAGGRGDVSESHTVWKQPLRSGIDTPIIVDGNLHWIASGIAYCADCKTGEYVYKERLAKTQGEGGRRRPSGDYASPVSIGDKILILRSSGLTHVLEAGDKFKEIGTNPLENNADRFSATPAISDGQIFIRSNKKLFSIAK